MQEKGKIRKGRMQIGTAGLVAADYITGVQYLGIPVRDMNRILRFYGDLGFEEAFSMRNSGKRMVFVKRKNPVIELYEEDEVAAKPGAINHVALDVTDVERTLELAGALGYEMLDTEIQFLPFWEHGVKFFIVMGPNGEKVEFSQKM